MASKQDALGGLGGLIRLSGAIIRKSQAGKSSQRCSSFEGSPTLERPREAVGSLKRGEKIWEMAATRVKPFSWGSRKPVGGEKMISEEELAALSYAEAPMVVTGTVPGPKTRRLLETSFSYESVARGAGRFPCVYDEGMGVTVKDPDGNVFIAIAVASVWSIRVAAFNVPSMSTMSSTPLIRVRTMWRH